MVQTARGKAFEYALARRLSEVTNSPLVRNNAADIAEGHYQGCGLGPEMDQAASEAILFLQAYDRRFDDAVSVSMQSDRRGRLGDVRDVVVLLGDNTEIGLSAKRHNQAAKHPRLSGTIDFGNSWADCPVSQQYWDAVRPYFSDLADMKALGMLFRDIPDKEDRFYLPVVTAFQGEFERLSMESPDFVSRVFRYLVGRYDFYKVLLQRNHVGVHSYNIHGTLRWGSRWRIPNTVEQIHLKEGSSNTLIVTFAGGWRMSLRIHSASSRVEPSLKFDVRFDALPVSVGQNQIPLENR